MDGSSIVSVQLANKFCYDHAVSRVQLRLTKSENVLLFRPKSKNNDVVISYSETARVKLAYHKIKFSDHLNDKETISSRQNNWDSFQID